MSTNNQLNNPSTLISVSEGGTGVSTMTTAYAPVCGGTTSTGALAVASTGLVTSNNVLMSNGSSALPSFQALPVSITKTSLTLTTTNIHNMYGTPVQVLANQGANTIILIYTCVFEYISGGTGFSGGDAGSFNGPILQYGNTAHGGGQPCVLSSLGSLGTTSIISFGAVNDGDGILNSFNSDPSSGSVNTAIYATNADAAYTGGNGSIKVTIYYSVISTTV